MPAPGFGITQPCGECPWRKDVPTGKFPPERFEALRGSVEQGFAPMFACHRTKEGEEQACAGYMLSADSLNNFNVRLTSAEHPEYRSDVPLFETYDEMARANGYKP